MSDGWWQSPKFSPWAWPDGSCAALGFGEVGKALQLSLRGGGGVLHRGDPRTPTEEAANRDAAWLEGWSGKQDDGLPRKVALAGGGRVAGGPAEGYEAGGGVGGGRRALMCVLCHRQRCARGRTPAGRMKSA